jgi:hypothetical protein
MEILSRNIDEMTINNLKKVRKYTHIVFIFYLLLEIAMIIISGYLAYVTMPMIMNISENTVITLLLLFGALNLMNFFMIFMVWFCCESSYYKMLQLHMDQMIFLKRRLGE